MDRTLQETLYRVATQASKIIYLGSWRTLKPSCFRIERNFCGVPSTFTPRGPPAMCIIRWTAWKAHPKRIEVQPSLTKHVFNFIEFMKQKGLSLFYPPVPNQRTSIVTLVTKKPVTGGDATNSNKPFASSCVAIGNQVAYSLDLGDRFLRTIRDQVLAIGEENYPLTIRLTPAGHKHFKQSQGTGESIIATAGMSLSELLEFTFMLPLSFRKIAACDSLVENYSIPLKRLTVTLFDLNTDYCKTRTVLADQKRLPWIRWSGFTGQVPGNPGACSHPYSFHGIKGKLPDNLEPTSFGQLGVQGCTAWLLCYNLVRTMRVSVGKLSLELPSFEGDTLRWDTSGSSELEAID